MTLLLHLSDTHFGTEQPPVVEALLQLVQQQRPDVAVLSGDVTQRARAAEFTAAKAFIERLQIPAWVTLPGNHDIPLFDLATRLFAPYRRHRRVFGAELQPEYEDAAMLIVGVNTTRRYRHVDGSVSATQVERVAARLRLAAAGKLKLVVTHQPVHVTRERDEEDLLHGRAAALQAWSEAGADLILGGHIHLPYTAPLREAHGLPRELWAVQAGTAVSSRIRAEAPNSVNLIRHKAADTQCSVERWDYSAADRRFAAVQCTDITLDRKPE